MTDLGRFAAFWLAAVFLALLLLTPGCDCPGDDCHWRVTVPF